MAGLSAAEGESHFINLYNIFIQQLQVVLPQNSAIPAAYENGSDEEQDFVQNLALFFTAFFKVRYLHSNIVPMAGLQKWSGQLFDLKSTFHTVQMFSVKLTINTVLDHVRKVLACVYFGAIKQALPNEIAQHLQIDLHFCPSKKTIMVTWGLCFNVL